MVLKKGWKDGHKKRRDGERVKQAKNDSESRKSIQKGERARECERVWSCDGAVLSRQPLFLLILQRPSVLRALIRVALAGLHLCRCHAN